MEIFLLVCATLGGTILVCQVFMMVLGLGGGFHGDTGDGGDFAGDVHDVAGGHLGGDVHGDTGGHDGGTDGHDHTGDHAQEHGQETHHSSWLFAMISFRTLVAAMTFFGLAGLAASSAGASTPTVVGVALAAGWAAMYGVYRLMQLLGHLRAEGTVRVERALGQIGSVYLRIPGHRSGCGKIHLNLQNRTMEYSAVTDDDEIPTGATVEVVEVVDTCTLLVQVAV